MYHCRWRGRGPHTLCAALEVATLTGAGLVERNDGSGIAGTIAWAVAVSAGMAGAVRVEMLC